MAQPVQTVAVIGTGVIGASWAACFLANGLNVAAWDPAPGAEAALRRAVEAHWPAMEARGLSPGAAPERLRVFATAEEAVAEAGFVQESGPERLDLKRELFRRLDSATAAGVVLASSSSTLMVSEFQDTCALHPERVLLGHPFNPPHLIPLVEVVGGQQTSGEAVAKAMAFYAACGKHPIHLKREMRGHVANRLQAALWQEAFHLVSEGMADVADIDAAIAHGPGLRWALLGPFLNLHLSGGAGGIGELFGKPLWEATESMWRDLGRPTLDAALRRKVVEGVGEMIGDADLEAVKRRRDELLLDLVRRKAGVGLPP